MEITSLEYQDKLHELVFKWVETTHLHYELENLVEYSDELGELFNFEEWLFESEDKNVSIMGLHQSIEKTANLSNDLENKAEKALTKELIRILEEDESELYFEKKINNIKLENMDEFFLYLYEWFEDIYVNDIEGQYSNFKKAVLSIDKQLENDLKKRPEMSKYEEDDIYEKYCIEINRINDIIADLEQGLIYEIQKKPGVPKCNTLAIRLKEATENLIYKINNNSEGSMETMSKLGYKKHP